MPNDSTTIFRDNVKIRLAELGWQQQDLAHALGVNPSVITSIMRGGGMTLERLDRWAAALGITPTQLISPGMGSGVSKKPRKKSAVG